MTIKVYEENGSTVIAPEGKIDHVTVEEFENKMTELGERARLPDARYGGR